MRLRRPSGFTLVDGALAVASLALLASIAVPEWQARELRTRLAERDAVLASIVQAVQTLEPAAPRPAPAAPAAAAAPTPGDGSPPASTAPVPAAPAPGTEAPAAPAPRPAAPAVLAGAWNPPTVPGEGKGAWVVGKEGWKRIPGVSPGSTWCSYQFVLDEERSPARLLVASDCDLDGDGVHAVTVRTFTRSGTSFVPTGQVVPPPSIF